MKPHMGIVAWRDTAHAQAGGSEVLVDRLARGMGNRGWDVSLVAGGPVGTNPYPTYRGGGTYDQYVRGPVNYRRHLRDADVVLDVANGMVAFTPLWRRGPTVCLVHHVHTEQWHGALPAPLARLGHLLEARGMPAVYKKSLFVAVSPSTKAALVDLGIQGERIHVVPNGVDIPDAAASCAPRSATPLFVSIGRMVPHKRHATLLRAWDRVRPVTGGELVLVGDGPLAESLQAQAGEGVRFVGHVSDLERDTLVEQAWLNVHPASHEGWGLVILEAGARGTPTLGFDVPGVRDAVVDGRTGELARDEDDLVDRWIRLATDPCRCRGYGEAARVHARSYSWNRTVERFDEVVREAIDHHRAPTAVPVRAIATTSAAGDSWRRTELSIVIPAFNEECRLGATLQRLAAVVPMCETEVIVVDDGSTDDTAAIAGRELRVFPNHRLVRLETNAGKGAAVREGIRASRGNRIVMMDADLATDLRCLAPLLDALTHADIAIGSRSVPGSVTTRHTMHRAVMGRTFNRFTRRTTGLDVLDTQCGFKAFRAPVAALLFGMGDQQGFAFDVEVLLCARRLGLSVREVPVHWTAVSGTTVRPARDSLRMLRDVYELARSQPLGRFMGVCFDRSAEGLDREAKLVRSVVRAGDLVLVNDQQIDVLLPWSNADGADLVRQRIERLLCRPALSAYEADAPTVIDLVSASSLVSA